MDLYVSITLVCFYIVGAVGRRGPSPTTIEAMRTSRLRPPPSRSPTTSLTSSTLLTSTPIDTSSSLVGIATTVPTVVVVNNSGIVSTETMVVLYCLIGLILVIMLVVGGLWALKKSRKKRGSRKFSRNMQSNYVMYSEGDENAHAYTNPHFRYGEEDNEYSEIQVDQMVKMKSFRAKSFRTLAHKMSVTEQPPDYDESNNEELNIKLRQNKGDAANPREDSSGYLMPETDIVDEVFLKVQKDKENYLDFSVAPGNCRTKT